MTDLTPAEQTAAAAEFWGNATRDGVNRRTWADMTEQQRADMSAVWRKRHPAPARAAPNYVTVESLDATLNELIDGIGAETKKFVAEKFGELEAKFGTTLADVLAAASSVNEVASRVVCAPAAAGASGDVAELRKQVDELRKADEATTETLASVKRQLSRHVDHLSGLENRLKKIERSG
jgi:hypothetical protein